MITRSWERRRTAERCGFCGWTIPPGEPVLLLVNETRKVALFRCELCAGEAAPELPELPPLPHVDTPLGRRHRPVTARRDWKISQAGDEQ